MKRKRIALRLTAAALSALMGLSAGCYPAMSSLASDYERVNGFYEMRDGTVLDQVIARGIDVSRWQGRINWNAVANDDVSFVMLGTRSRGDVDPTFHTNIQGASQAGIKIGAYIYSLATTPDMARQEADFVLNLVKDYPLNFPIAFDAEDSATLGTLSPTQVSEVINAFCDRIEEAGYYPIVYANENWLKGKIDLSKMERDVWVARYDTAHTYPDPVMWQVTSTGNVDGIQGNVDINFLYEDLTPNLPSALWRTIGDHTYYYQDYTIQRNTWIHDGTGWFYMDQEGAISRGWRTFDGLKYHLNETTGRMDTGWQYLADKWYFFLDSGELKTGWLLLDNTWYYLNQDGTMKTGWLKENDIWYYLNHDGDMKTGWLEENDVWYYLNHDGSMKTGWLEDNGSKYYLSASSGKMITGWREIDGAWYYFHSSGTMATGMITVEQKQYYLEPDGRMAANTVMDIDGVSYTIDANGVCTLTPVEVSVDEESETGEAPLIVTPAPTEDSTKEIGPGINS